MKVSSQKKQEASDRERNYSKQKFVHCPRASCSFQRKGGCGWHLKRRAQKLRKKTSRNRPEQEGPCSLNTAINRKLLFWSGGPGGC